MKYYDLLAILLLIKILSTSILLNPGHPSNVQESQKLQINFPNNGAPMQITTNNEILKINSGTVGATINEAGAFDIEPNNLSEESVPVESAKVDDNQNKIEVNNAYNDGHGIILSANVHTFDPQGHYNELIYAGQMYNDTSGPVMNYGHKINEQPPNIAPEFHGSYTNYVNSKVESVNDSKDLINYLENSLGNNKLESPIMLSPDTVKLILSNLQKPSVEPTSLNSNISTEDQLFNKEDIETLNESHAELTKKLDDLLNQINSLMQEIAQLRAMGEEKEAEKLEIEEAKLELEKQRLELEVIKKEDQELRKQLEELKKVKENLEQDGADIEVVLEVQEKIVDIEVQDAYVDEEIKENQINLIEESLNELGHEKEMLENQGVVDPQQIEDIEAQMAELLQEEQLIASDHQIEEELDQDIAENDNEITHFEDLDAPSEDIQKLVKAKLKLKAQRHLIEERNDIIEAKIQNDVEVFNNQNTLSSGQENSQNVNIGSNNNLAISSAVSLENNGAIDYTKTPDSSNFNFTAVSYVLIALANLSSDYHNSFSLLPKSQEDIPTDLMIKADELNYLYGELKVFDKTFKNHVLSSKHNYTYVYDALASVQLSSEGVIKFYDLLDRYNYLNEIEHKENIIFKAKLAHINAEIDLISESFKSMVENVKAVDTLTKLTEAHIQEFINETKNEETLTVTQKSALAVKYTPKLIEYRKEFDIIFAKLRDELIEVRDKRLSLGTAIEELIKLGEENQTEGKGEAKVLDNKSNISLNIISAFMCIFLLHY